MLELKYLKLRQLNCWRSALVPVLASDASVFHLTSLQLETGISSRCSYCLFKYLSH